jgi:hypothetical protein
MIRPKEIQVGHKLGLTRKRDEARRRTLRRKSARGACPRMGRARSKGYATARGGWLTNGNCPMRSRR